MDDYGVTLIDEDGNDNLIGRYGTDKLFGGLGDDQIYGNNGNDLLYRGTGDDTYVFNAGYGTDTIVDSEGINSIVLGSDLTQYTLTAYRTDWNNLTITFENIDDKLIINDYFTNENSKKFNLSYANRIKFAYDDNQNPLRQVHATEHDYLMNAWNDDGIVIYGNKGNDNLTRMNNTTDPLSVRIHSVGLIFYIFLLCNHNLQVYRT